MNRCKRGVGEVHDAKSKPHEAFKQNTSIGMKEIDKPKSFSVLKYAASLLILLILFTFISVQNLYDAPQESKAALHLPLETPVLMDPDTAAEIKVFKVVEEPTEVLTIKSDAMDRGNHEYAAYPLLIDPTAFIGKSVSRGDVVVYEYDFANGTQKTISRVVGLPGESIGITDGQIFVNGQRVEAFYGKAHRAGTSNPEEYRIWFEENMTSSSSNSGMEEIFRLDLEETILLENEVFLVGDDWFRGSQHLVELDAIQGKVLGYYKD